MSFQDKQNDSGVLSIIGDLKVLLQKCSRDIPNRIGINAELYRNGFNAILNKAKQELPDVVNDIETITKKSYSSGRDEVYDHIAAMYEVDSAASKLLTRLEQKRRREDSPEPLSVLEKYFSRFHQVARQLRSRHGSRETLDVSDEYDVQNLLHALLKLHFDDIRTEEWAPSYAGGSSRMDFLLKSERVVIEVKKTRERLGGKEIGEQLIIDITRYKEHPDCKTLACFVYDPEGKIGNPTGLENDLAKLSTDNLDVKVYIFPK